MSSKECNLLYLKILVFLQQDFLTQFELTRNVIFYSSPHGCTYIVSFRVSNYNFMTMMT